MVVDLTNVPLSSLAAAIADVDFGNQNAINVLDPTADQDAATKKYHDDNKYTDAEAVAAADVSDKFIERDVENVCSAITTLKRSVVGVILNFINEVPSGQIMTTTLNHIVKSTTHTFVNGGGMVTFPVSTFQGTDTSKIIGKTVFVKLPGGTKSYSEYFILNSAGSTVAVLKLEEDKIDVKNLPIKNIKNHADATLSGTPKIIEFLIGATPYYFKVYPTKT